MILLSILAASSFPWRYPRAVRSSAGAAPGADPGAEPAPGARERGAASCTVRNSVNEAGVG